ncbi:hypothetical protein DNTS_006569 [Danionella cerebrum]|uniref:Uncharacterized protein n=1 Tax=Danionella cerebrum TaxID=2873325 RepID=A0A553NAF6_9TELE|nr:hypothetical protein DNTS_006569 [Danionella translucida]
MCEERYCLEAKEQAKLQKELTSLLITVMNRKEKNQGESMTDDSMPESSLESGSDYIPSSSPSSEERENLIANDKVALSSKNLSANVHEPGQSCSEAFNEDYFAHPGDPDGASKDKGDTMVDSPDDSNEGLLHLSQRPEPSEKPRLKKKRTAQRKKDVLRCVMKWTGYIHRLSVEASTSRKALPELCHKYLSFKEMLHWPKSTKKQEKRCLLKTYQVLTKGFVIKCYCKRADCCEDCINALITSTVLNHLREP